MNCCHFKALKRLFACPLRLTQLSKPSCVAPSVGPAPRCSSSLSTWSRPVCRLCRAACSLGESEYMYTHTVISITSLHHMLSYLVTSKICYIDWMNIVERFTSAKPCTAHESNIHWSFFFFSVSLSECSSFSSGRVGMVTVLLSVVRTERLLGLWKGISPVITSLCCLFSTTTALLRVFCVYEKCS